MADSHPNKAGMFPASIERATAYSTSPPVPTSNSGALSLILTEDFCRARAFQLLRTTTRFSLSGTLICSFPGIVFSSIPRVFFPTTKGRSYWNQHKTQHTWCWI